MKYDSYEGRAEYVRQMLLWGYADVVDGEIERRELPDYWKAYRPPGFTRDPRIGIDPAGGPESTVVWYDEAQMMTHETGWRSRLIVGGRGHGKRAAQIEALRKWNSRPEAFIPHNTPPIGEVRWACRQPTTPAYREGTYGWMMEQAAARISPAEREYNRKLSEQIAAKVSAIHDILGVKK